MQTTPLSHEMGARTGNEEGSASKGADGAWQAWQDERGRLSRELHDDLGQRLTAARLKLAAVKRTDHACQEVLQAADWVSERLDEALVTLRRLTTQLRSGSSPPEPLAGSLPSLVEQMSQGLGLPIELRLRGVDPPWPQAVAHAAYRIVQESLTNIGRHARATRARVLVHADGARLGLVIEDDGVGFPPDSWRRPGACGLQGMAERVAALGGSLQLHNPAAGGARVQVQIPLELPTGSAP